MKVSKRLRQSPSLAPQLASSTCAKDGASPSPPPPPAQKAARQVAQKEACQVRVGVGCLVEHPGILPVKVQRLRDQGRTPSAVELVVCRRCTPQLLDERQKRRQEERRGKFKSSNVLWGRLIHATQEHSHCTRDSIQPSEPQLHNCAREMQLLKHREVFTSYWTTINPDRASWWDVRTICNTSENSSRTGMLIRSNGP